MTRYRTEGQGDDTPLVESDVFFSGFKSRVQPTLLEPGEASYLGNMRCDRGTAQVRKGIKALSNDITLVNPPLIVGAFSLAVSKAVTSITRVGAVATVTTTANHGFTSADRVNTRGAVQPEYNGDFTIVVTGLNTYTYTVSGTPTTPATGTILVNKGPRVFNTYSSAVVGSGAYADSTSNTEGIVIASVSSAYLYRYGLSTLTLSYPSNETCDPGAPCDIVQFINKVYIFRGYQTAIPLAVTTLTSAATTATVTTTLPHGLSTNNWVTIANAVPSGYNGIYKITVTGATTFTYTLAGALASPATGTITARPCKPALSWDLNTTTAAFVVVPTGLNAAGAPIINMPAVDWGTFFKSRFILPYSKDQLVLSDILDPNSYDPSQNQFRLLPGTADWLVAAYPYQEGRFLALYRKSVHSIVLDNTSLAIAQAFEITRNFGCVARKTIANSGPHILWLSDQGVVRMEIGNELSLKNTASPLSDPIQDIIDTINWSAAGMAVATFWKNRYYLAVPIGTSTVNNYVLVYNFINEQWESVDTFPNGFDVQGFQVISYNGSERVHAVSSLGFVYLTEELDYDEFGAPGNVSRFQIPGLLKTRNYLGGTYDMKRTRRIQLEVNLLGGEIFTANWVQTNPDTTFQAIAFTAQPTSTTNVTLRSTIGRRGVSGRLEIASTQARPEFKAVVVEATVTNRQTINFN